MVLVRFIGAVLVLCPRVITNGCNADATMTMGFFYGAEYQVLEGSSDGRPGAAVVGRVNSNSADGMSAAEYPKYYRQVRAPVSSMGSAR